MHALVLNSAFINWARLRERVVSKDLQLTFWGLLGNQTLKTMALVFALVTELVPRPNNTLAGDCRHYRPPCIFLSEPLNIAQYENQWKLEKCLACSMPHGPPCKTKGFGTTAHIPGITVWAAWHGDNGCNPSVSAGVSLIQRFLVSESNQKPSYVCTWINVKRYNLENG